MQRRVLVLAIAVLVSLVAAVPAQSASRINAYRVKATAKNLERLALAGFDVTEGRRGRVIEVYGTARQMARFTRKNKVRTRLVKDKKGRTSAQRSRLKVRRGLKELGFRMKSAQVDPTANASDAAYKVYRKYDAVPNDGHEQYTEFYNRIVNQYDNIAAKTVIGETEWGRDIIAIQVSRGADGEDNGRPAVLYNSLQHAREWLAGETCKRTIEFFTKRYGSDRQVTRLVNTRQLWFVCVNNPDGYEYTFTPGNRLWRKNLHDNNGDHQITGVDGVDPNRNFPVDWGLDDEGSSPDPSSETYRGPGDTWDEAKQPETLAMLKLWNMVDFAFEKNDHTAAELLLYPQGWQQYTPAADDPIFTALAGDDEDPAIPTFDPDLGAELYITNGDTLDTAYNQKEILAYTPEGTEAKDLSVSAFEYADDEGQLNIEWVKHRNFVLDLAESADDPDDPDSHLGNTVRNFYVDSFAYSYGDPQTVQVLAKRDLDDDGDTDDVDLKYRINNGPVQTADTTEWSDGQRYYQERGAYYHRLRGLVTGAGPGATVEVWFDAGGGQRSPSFTYQRAGSGKRVLVVAAEDYTGPTPTVAGPNYIDEYERALTANGFAPDVYDIDARGRKAPHPLGVLSHYDAVVWYTGDDYLTREPGQVPGTGTSRLALDEIVAMRDYLNEGGKLVLSGKHAGQQYFEGFEFRNYGFPQPNESKFGEWCDADLTEDRDGCIPHTDDFFQYYMGSYLRVDNGGSWNAANNEVVPVVGVSPFAGTWDPPATPGDPGAGAPTATLASTSSLVDTEAYDDFSEVIASWDRDTAGPFSPRSGTQYLYSGTSDAAYMRLYQDVTVPTTGDAHLRFATSFDTENLWDFFFVEVAPVGTDDWTTLPDANGHTTQETGESCHTDNGWAELHPKLEHYQTKVRDECTPEGTTGEWNAATGSSGGWQEWDVNLEAYRGQQVQIALVYATDWAVQNLGVWLEDISLFGGAPVTFEDGTLGGWQAGSLPEPHNQATWGQPTTQSFEEGAVLGTKDLTFVTPPAYTPTQYQSSEIRDTVFAGFELGTLNETDRATFFGEVLEYFGMKTEND
jgi:murein tripeptide amidase MpaA